MSMYGGGSAGNCSSVTPNDSADLPSICRGIWVGGAGNLAVTLSESGENITFTGVPAGTLLPLEVKRVYATGTTATNLVAVW